jgi:hypothetical protein
MFVGVMISWKVSLCVHEKVEVGGARRGGEKGFIYCSSCCGRGKEKQMGKERSKVAGPTRAFEGRAVGGRCW